MDLQKQAQARLARSRARFAEGMDDAREVRQNLEWTQKKVSWVLAPPEISPQHPKAHGAGERRRQRSLRRHFSGRLERAASRAKRYAARIITGRV